MKILKILNYKVGYKVETRLYESGDICESCPEITIREAYTPAGEYIGTPRMARFLVKKRGISPEKAFSEDNICSIGFCERDNKWYGWSHRAIAGFGIGDKVFEVDFGDDNTLFTEHGTFTIESLDQAKQSAVIFADYVS